MGKIVGHCTVGWQVNEAQMVEVVVVDEYETFTHLSAVAQGFSLLPSIVSLSIKSGPAQIGGLH